ncbi:histidine utilization repressor [Salmonella enterica subsp. enterica]|uniref:Histidine utilization repressor n=1 Tax=Salmonella enterica I TaxID=59201 RepID=A0A447MVK4_SALET|nr:histidine utilization repressor [Salmonella enterica subsp. enterica]
MKMAQRRAWRRGLAGKSRTGGVNLSSGKHYPHKEGFHACIHPAPVSAPAPFYETVKQDICKKIADGVWQPHDRIPSEAELVAQYGFSRMTINRALRELTDEGWLVRLQGVGTFVAEPKGQSALFEVRSIAEEIAARRHQHRCEVLTLERVRANAIQASALNVNESDVIFHSIMVHYENDLPVQIEDRCVNADIAVDYLTQDYRQTTPHALFVADRAANGRGTYCGGRCAPRRKSARG